jgi:hypothetical protein
MAGEEVRVPTPGPIGRVALGLEFRVDAMGSYRRVQTKRVSPLMTTMTPL